MRPHAVDRPVAAASQKQKRCWNCRTQKIACDKTLPSCRNCNEKGQACLGYGLKLSWPREDDERRSASTRDHYTVPVQLKDLDYINTSARDVEASQKQGNTGQNHVFGLTQQPYNGTTRLDPLLPTNQYSPVARLVSSRYHDADDIFGLFVRLSLSDDELPSLATRHAISALTYQHLRMEETAVMHQTCAIRALQASIENLDQSRAMQTMAASMLLSIFETLHFETSALSWSIFFCGTKRIASLVTQRNNDYAGDEALLMDWIFYHDTMYKFSIRHWQDKNEDQIALAAQKKVISKAVFSPERQIIVPILGCSLELLDLVCQVIDSVFDRGDPHYHSQAHLKTIRSLEIRLQDLEQRHSGVSDVDAEEVVRQTNIAELFRLAALTYLYRLAKGEPRDSAVADRVINRAFAILSLLEYCERPWPLFITALEARTEEQRIAVLAVLKGSLARQPLGTIALANRMIHESWIRQDLHEAEMDPLILYGLIVSRNRVPPCFA